MLSTEIFREAAERYRNGGLTPLLRSAPGYAAYLVHRKIRKSRVFRGEHQFDFYTDIRYRLHRRLFRAPADPWTPIYIDPRSIQSLNTEIKKEWGFGRVKGGEWDAPEHCEPLPNHAVYHGLRQRFEAGLPWEETTYFEKARRKIAAGKNRYGYNDLDTFREVRCAWVDDLYRSIKEDGYRPNFERGHSAASNTSSKVTTKRFIHRFEPVVVIGREGDPFLRDGVHRVAIASILEIDEIPVHVLGRHRRWQARRDALATSQNDRDELTTDEFDLSHPDFQDLLESPEE